MAWTNVSCRLCWPRNIVWLYAPQFRLPLPRAQKSTPPKKLNGSNGMVADSVETITNRILAGEQTGVPTVLNVDALGPTPTELADALGLASDWIVEQIREINGEAAWILYAKWNPAQQAQASMVQEPEWALKILLLDCWKDARLARRIVDG